MSGEERHLLRLLEDAHYSPSRPPLTYQTGACGLTGLLLLRSKGRRHSSGDSRPHLADKVGKVQLALTAAIGTKARVDTYPPKGQESGPSLSLSQPWDLSGYWEWARTTHKRGLKWRGPHSLTIGKTAGFLFPLFSNLSLVSYLLLPGSFPLTPVPLPCPSPTSTCLFSHPCGGGGRGGGSQEQVSSLQHDPGQFLFRYRQLCLSL